MTQVAHSVRGRLRIRYPAAWLQSRRPRLEQRLRSVPGVRSARGSDLTGSLLIDYDPFSLAEHALLATLDAMTSELGGAPPREKTAAPDKVDIRRAPLLTLLGTSGVLGLTGVSMPAPLMAGRVGGGRRPPP